MSAAITIVSELRGKGVSIRVEGSDLRLRAPKGVVSPDMLEAIKHQKYEIIRLVEPIDNLLPEDLTDIDLQFYQELYEIMTGPKFGMTPINAEREAMIIVKGSMMIIRLKGEQSDERQ